MVNVMWEGAINGAGHIQNHKIGPMGWVPSILRSYAHRTDDAFSTTTHLPGSCLRLQLHEPVIAMISGPAVAGGLELVL